jgi:hypothetical protein
MAAPQDTIDKVRRRLVDLSATNPLAGDPDVIDEAIASAVSRYTTDRPRELTADVTGAGSEYYPLTGDDAVLASWSDGVSQITAIDYPAKPVSAGYAPTWLDKTFDWTTYRDGAGVTYLRFLTVTPLATETARVTYTAPHIHSTALDTIPSGDLDAVCDLAASYACQALATKMAASQDSLISADSTNYRDGQLRFSQQAKGWLDSYKARLGITDGVAGASAVADWNRTTTTGGPFLTHSRRWR